MKKEVIIAWLKTVGVEVANEATDEQVQAALQKVGTQFANDQQALKDKDKTIAAISTERDAARTEFANERKAHRGVLVAQAITAGRITEAQRAVWEGRLERDFANESVELGKVTSTALKTQSTTDDLGKRKGEAQGSRDRVAKISDLVRAKQQLAEFANDYDAAFAAVKRENPALFGEQK